MNILELEDFHGDILGKAMRGLGIGKNELAQSISSKKTEIEAILNGAFDEALIGEMALKLNLDKEKILMSAKKECCPALVELSGLKQFTSSYCDMIVNSFLIWDELTNHSWIFDTGTEISSVLQFISEKKLKVDAIFLTHTHRDHVACLDKLRENTENPSVFVHKLELINGCVAIEEGYKYSLGSLSLETRHTHGHSVGGITYIISGLSKKLAIVGDAIFAGSMGGGMVSYKDALRTNREKIMSLPDETVLCPGHGPMTTVGEEKKYNPFFPEF